MTHWTLADAPDDLTGKIYAITGTSSGIGTVIAHELARRGAKVVAGNRNTQKAEHAMPVVQSASGGSTGYPAGGLDVSSWAVRAFAKQTQADPAIPPIDGLVLNVGIMAKPERKVAIGARSRIMREDVDML